MVKAKALADPRRDRPLHAKSRGITKQKKRRDKDEEQERGDAGVVGKKKKTFYTVLAGQNPAIYNDKETYDRACRAHPEAKCYFAHHQRKVQAVIKDYQQRLEHEQKAAGPGTTHAGYIRFDTYDLPRGFALGRVRMNGKNAISEAAKPLFSFSGPSARDEPLFPQHGSIEAEKVISRALATEANDPDQPSPGAVQTSPTGDSGSESDDLAAEPEHKRPKVSNYEDQDNGQQGGQPDTPQDGLDDDFIAFGDESGSDDDGEVDETPVSAAGAEAGQAPTWRDDELPWYKSNTQIAAQSIRLHNEIVELTTLLRPVPAEDAQRVEAKSLLEDLIKGIFPTAAMEIFGSFATGLHLPTSDVDCVILCDQISRNGTVPALKAIGSALQRKDWATEVEVVASAKVPIVKLVVMPYGLKFDLSVGMGNGVHAVDYIRAALADWPPLQPLVTVLKLFLLQRQMNEVFTGGLSSFSLILSVLAFLKMHPSRRKGRDGRMQPLDCNLGLLLIDYFRFYGRQLDLAGVGVSCNDGGYCYKKRSTFPQQTKWRGRSGDRFSIMDPLDSNNDVAGGSFASSAVRGAFDHAYQMLTYQPADLRTMVGADLRAMRGQPLLGSILRLDEVLAIRPPPRRTSGGGGRRDDDGGPGKGNGRRGRDDRKSSKGRRGSRGARDGSDESGAGRRGGGGGARGGRGGAQTMFFERFLDQLATDVA